MASSISLIQSESWRSDIEDGVLDALSDLPYPDAFNTLRSQDIHFFAERLFEIIHQTDEVVERRVCKLDHQINVAPGSLRSRRIGAKKADALHTALLS